MTTLPFSCLHSLPLARAETKHARPPLEFHVPELQSHGSERSNNDDNKHNTPDLPLPTSELATVATVATRSSLEKGTALLPPRQPLRQEGRRAAEPSKEARSEAGSNRDRALRI